MLLELYNGFGIQAYGVCIALGALLATYLIHDRIRETRSCA